jgi:hypothetical protein
MTRVLRVHRGEGQVIELGPWDDWEAAVGGYIEPVTLKECMIFLNENSKRLGLLFNADATNLAIRLGWRPVGFDYLAGPVLFLGLPRNDKEADVPESVIKAWESYVAATSCARARRTVLGGS